MEERDLEAMKEISKAAISQGYKLSFVEGKKTIPGFYAVEITAKFVRKIDCPENKSAITEP